MNFRSIILILIILSVSSALVFNFAFAAVLEVGIPGQAGAAPGDPLPTLEQYMRYVYFFMLGTVGIAAFMSLIWYGVMWIYSGIVEKKSEALEGIKNTFIGIGLAFGAYIILHTINPDIVKLSAPILPTFDATQTKEGAGTAITKSIVPTPTGSLQALASEILTKATIAAPITYVSPVTNSGARWLDCRGSFANFVNQLMIITVSNTLGQIKDGEAKVNTCKTGCSQIPNNACSDTISISEKMIRSIWSVINTRYPAGSIPSFAIIEMVGGDRLAGSSKTTAHYGGRAIDVVPTAGNTQNEYMKILSAFAHTGVVAVCTDVGELIEYKTCDVSTGNIDHMHIEW